MPGVRPAALKRIGIRFATPSPARPNPSRAVAGCPRRSSIPQAQRLHGPGVLPGARAGVQRAGLRSSRTACPLRARRPPDRAARTDWSEDDARRPRRREAAQQPQRPRVPLERGPLLHRSAVRPARGLRRSGKGAALQRGVPALRGGSAHAADARAPRAQRHRLLPVGTHALREQRRSDARRLDGLRYAGRRGARPGPGLLRGVHVFSPDGAHLGSIELDVPASNVAWGENGSVLYVTADTAVYRIQTRTKGVGF